MRNILCLLAVALSLGTPLARAQQSLPPVDRGYVAAGVYDLSSGLSGRWDSTSGALGTSFDTERDLGFDGNELSSAWAIGGSLGEERAHKLDAVFYGYEDEGQRVLTRDFRIEDEVYPVGGLFSGSLDVDVTGAAYTWMFHRRERQAGGIGLGLVQYDFEAELAVETRVGGAPVAQVVNVLGSKVIAPLLRAEYVRSVGEHWRIGGAASYVRADRDDASGDALDAHVRVEWFPWERFGFGLRYNYNEIDLDFERRRFTGNLDVKNHGVQLFAMLRY